MSSSTGRIQVGITGVGMNFPERVVTNHDLAKTVDTSHEWIVERTGIHERRFVEPGTGATVIAEPAARDALAMAGVDPADVECIIMATITPDTIFPSAGCILQDKLGAKKAWAFDLSGACSGWVYAATVAESLIRSGRHENVLVVGVDIMTTMMDMNDRNTCVLFGDGAGATFFQRLPEGREGVLDSIVGADGSGGKYLYMPAGGSAKPASLETVQNNEHRIVQDGRNVYKAAVEGMSQIAVQLLENTGHTGEDVGLFVPHQANLRIIDAARRRAGLPMEKVMVNIDRYGNTTSGTIPSALCQAVQEGRLKEGDLVLCVTFGAGFTWGGIALRWTASPR